MRREFACVFMLMLPAPLAAIEAAEARLAMPNVVIVLTDDQGYGDLSCHGNPVLKTPTLDRLCAESIRLTDFHVAPMCTPTRGQLMTGRHALANGAYCVCSGRTFLRRDVPTMAELFAASGYRTALFGKWHLGDNYPHRPNDRGFQEAVYHLGWGITSTPDSWNGDYFDDWFRHNGRMQQYRGYCTDVFFHEACTWVRERAAQREPFLLYLAPNAPHGPFYCPEPYKRPYRNLDADTAGFFGMIANLDENLAKLDATLTEAGLRENTIFLFMTDNGGTGGIRVFNAGMRGAKASLYEGGHRAPCFLRWPAGGLRPAGDVQELADICDVLPTLLDLCGAAKPDGLRLDGASLAPLLRGADQPELAQRMLVVQYGGLVQSDPAPWDSAVMWRKWRLVGGKELYDIQADPSQRSDVASEQPGVVAKLRAHYAQWWAGVQPALREFGAIGVGSDRENPVCLSAMDWLAPKLTLASQPFDIRLLGRSEVKEGSLPGGRPQPVLNGVWRLQVEREGLYRISLRRWPREADAPIAGDLPPYQGVDGAFPAGVALPVAAARVKIGDCDAVKPLSPGDKEVGFDVRLAAGAAQLQTWFYDSVGREICGALYVEVLRR